jgi:hypothetical protein
MTHRTIVLAVLGLGLAVLCRCGDPCSEEPYSFAAFNNALAHEFGQERFPCPNMTQAPGPSGQAIGSGSTSACAPASVDDACVTCAKASCCTVSLTCFQEEACTCLVACRTVGCSSAETAQCGEPDASFTAVAACISDHCEKECPAR